MTLTTSGTKPTASEARELLQMDFSNTADWHREKAKEYPDDPRHLEAAELLDRLAASVNEVNEDLLQTYIRLSEDSEVHGEMLRAVGFSSSPASAFEFVSEFISERTGG